MTDITPSSFLEDMIGSSDPAGAAPYPRGLALDLVLQGSPLAEILLAYKLTAEQFQRILANQAFRTEYEQHKEEMQTEGWSFRKKAQTQAEMYLHTVHDMINDKQTPSAVKASLIQSTAKWAGLDNPGPTVAATAAQQLPQLAEALRNLPDGELEVRLMQVILKRSPTPQPTLVTGLTLDAAA